MNTKQKIFLSLLSGLLLSVAFPPYPLFFTVFFAFVPLFFILNENRDSNIIAVTDKKNKNIKSRKFLYVYITFFVYHLCSNYWISSFQDKTDPYLFWAGIALDIFHPIFFFFPFLLYFISNRLVGNKISIWLFPLFWTIFEWLHSIGDMGYSWLSIAHTQYTNLYWYQIVDIAGIWGATFLIVITNVFIYKLLLYNKNESGRFSFKFLFNSTKKKIYATTICLIFIVPMVYGTVQMNKYDYKSDLASSNNQVNIGLIQPNIDPWEKWDGSQFQQINTHLQLQDSLINSSSIGKLDLCIWCETAIPTLDLSVNRDMKLDFITDELIRTNTSLLTGIARYYFYSRGEKTPVTVSYFQNDTSLPYSSYNAAIMINPQNQSKTSIQFHHKAKLTPFAEGFPYIEYLTFAKEWLRWGIGVSAWTKGNAAKCLNLNNSKINAKIAPIICIESIYPDHVRKFVLDGADILTVITNDAWYNYSSGPEQHYIIAATRAIENRRYLARCANSGVTGFITPAGKTILRAPQYKEIGIAAAIPTPDSKDKFTLYTKYGDYLPVSFCFISILIVIYFIWRNSRKYEK